MQMSLSLANQRSNPSHDRVSPPIWAFSPFQELQMISAIRDLHCSGCNPKTHISLFAAVETGISCADHRRLELNAQRVLGSAIPKAVICRACRHKRDDDQRIGKLSVFRHFTGFKR
jgi:hypothetical protein